MTAKYLLAAAVCLMPVVADAAIPYRVQQTGAQPTHSTRDNDPQSFARDHRFYVGAMYDFSMWSGYTDKNDFHLGGKNTSSFEGVIGIRPYDIFRIEANYARTTAKWGDITLNSNTGFINAILDGRIDSMYRLFHSQRLIPYVGAGAGLSWNSVDNAHIDTKITPALAAMAGLGIELGDWFTIDVGYRYMYIFTPKFDVIDDLAPTAHQFRAGVRVNF